MINRLANVVNWTCTGFAILWIAIIVYDALTEPDRMQWSVAAGMIAMVAVPLWLFGRAFRYIIAGR